MRAVTKCPMCKRELETDCRGCIDMNEAPHICQNKRKVVKVKWEIIDDNNEEEDLSSKSAGHVRAI